MRRIRFNDKDHIWKRGSLVIINATNKAYEIYTCARCGKKGNHSEGKSYLILEGDDIDCLPEITRKRKFKK